MEGLLGHGGRTLKACRVSVEAVAALAPLYGAKNVEICNQEDAVWLRSADMTEQQWEICGHLPGVTRYVVLSDSQLVRWQTRVPQGHLPSGPWMPIREGLPFERPVASRVIRPPNPCPLVLARSITRIDSTWLLTDEKIWHDYAITAPQIRLARWSFVVDGQHRAIIRGVPLPPIPGEPLVEQAGIAVPAGWTWQPNVPAVIVRQVMGLSAGDSALWQPSGGWHRIVESDWVQATRSAVRASIGGAG